MRSVLLAVLLASAWPARGDTPVAPVVPPYSVGQDARVVRFRFSGRTHIRRGDVEGITAPCKDVSVAWICGDGKRVKKGDRVVLLDTSERLREMTMSKLDYEAAKRQLELQEMKLATQLTRMLEQKAALEAELRVAQASLASAKARDLAKEALLEENYILAERTATAKQAALKQREDLYELGEISREELLEARMAAELAQAGTLIPKIEWELAAGKIDRLAITKLRLREKELKVKLGLPVPGHASDGPQGIESQIEALRRKIERRREGVREETRRARRELHKAIRDSADHTPLTWLELSDPAGDVVRKVNFLPAGAKNAAGFLPDHGARFSTERGYGWDTDLSAMLFERDKTGEPDATVAVIEGQAVWQCRLPNGTYGVRVGLGDRDDWDGPLVRCGATVLYSEPRIKEKSYPVAEGTATASSGIVRVVFGDTCVKSLRAPGAGLVTFDAWLEPGRRVWGTDWPLAYYGAPEKFRVRARVHQDLVGLLKAAPQPKTDRGRRRGRAGRKRRAPSAGGRTPGPAEDGEPVPGPEPSVRPTVPAAPAAKEAPVSAEVAAAKRALATCTVRLTTAAGLACTGTVEKITTQPVRLSDRKLAWGEQNEQDAKDKIARELFLTLPAGAAKTLLLNETVECLCEIELPHAMFVVPVHLVSVRQNQCYVQEAGTKTVREISGFRVGAEFVAVAGLTAGMQLVPPSAERKPRAEQFFAGHVIANERSEVVAYRRIWGRIKELLPEGTFVEEGQTVVTLYSPRLESEKERFAEQRKKANQRFLEAAEERRLKNVQASLDHRGKVIAEELARNDVRVAVAVDPLVATRAEHKSQIAQLKRAHRARRYEHLAESGAAIPARVAAAEYAADLAAIEEQRKRIERSAALRKMDWGAVVMARAAWQDAVADLGLRESSIMLARLEEKVAGMRSKLELERALEGNRWERRFDQHKHVRAPRAGRIFYLKGWDDHAEAMTTFQKDSLVWGGVPIAEILDMSKLSFRAEVPEDVYPEVRPGLPATVVFPQFNHRRVSGTVAELGRRLYVPAEAVDEEYGKQALTSRRVFQVIVDFNTPEDLQRQLTPMTKGRLYLDLPARQRTADGEIGNSKFEI